MLCSDGMIVVDGVLLVGCDGLRQLRLPAIEQLGEHLQGPLQQSAMTSNSIWTRRDGAAGGSVAWRSGWRRVECLA